jgi:hypothetical protein
MSLMSSLTRPLRWLRAGYPPGSPRHGYIPLIALMPGPAAQIEDPPDAAEQPALLPAARLAGDARRKGPEKAAASIARARARRHRDPRTRA